MIPIKSEQLRVALLSHLIHLLDMGEVETLNAIAGMPQLDVSVHFDPATLETAYRRHEAITETRQLMEYHVRHGAHPQLLVHLFKMTMEQIREQRALLCPESQPRGRPPLPKPEMREAVQRAWPGIQSAFPAQRQYVELHRAFPELSIATLWYVVHEFDDCETA